MTPREIVKNNHMELNKKGFFKTYNPKTYTYQCINCSKENVYVTISMGQAKIGYSFICPNCYWSVTGEF